MFHPSIYGMLVWVAVNNVRFLTLGIIVLLLGGCANFYPQPSPAFTRSTSNVEPTSLATPAIQFVEATPTITTTLTEPASRNEDVNRTFENDLPLAARVNEQPIYLDTYQKQILQFESALTAQGIDLASSQGQARMAQIKQQVLDSLVDQAIINQEAARLGISVSPEEVELLAQDAIQNQPEFESWLTSNQLTYEEFIANLQAQVTTSRLFEQITGDTPQQAEQVQLQYIRVDDLTTAQSIVSQLNSGANFEILVQEHSPDDIIVTEDDNWYPKGTNLFPDPVETTAFSLQPGEVYGPIQSSAGYYIIKLEDKAANRPIADRMFNLLKKELFEKWLAEQRATAAIEIYVVL